MKVSVENVGGVCVVVIPGDSLDAGNARDFRHEVEPVLDSSDKIVLDLSLLRFVDSSGLGALLSCLRHVTAKEGELKISGMTKQVRGLFELVRLNRVFEIHDTAEQAVEAFR